MTARRHGTGTFIPRSVEGYRYAYGRTPTVAEFRASLAASEPVRPAAPVSNGCDCHDDECSICDPQGIYR